MSWSNSAAAWRRTCSRRARPEAVKPPPSGYLTTIGLAPPAAQITPTRRTQPRSSGPCHFNLCSLSSYELASRQLRHEVVTFYVKVNIIGGHSKVRDSPNIVSSPGGDVAENCMFKLS